MFSWKRLVAGASTIVFLVLAFVIFILPGMLVENASTWVSEETGRSLAVGDVSINPFGLSITIHKFDLSDSDNSKSFISWDLLHISLSSASLWHRAPVIDEFRLEKPEIKLARLDADTFNFSDLIPAQEEEKEPPEPDSAPLRFSINNINISDGHIELADHSLEEQVLHQVTELQLVLPSIGNLPYMIDDPAQPLFKAVINDSPVHIEGQIKPFTSNREMHVKLEFDNNDIPFYLSYVPFDLPVEVRNGKLNLDLDILYRFSEELGNEIILSGKASLTSLDIWDKLQKKLFFLPLLQIELAPSQPLKQELHLSDLRVYNLEVHLDRDATGGWNHARMTQGSPVEAETTQVENSGKKSTLKLDIDEIEIRDGMLIFRDELPAGGFETVAREINIDVKDFSLDTTKDIPLNLSLQTDRGETAKVNGHFQLNPFNLSLKTSLQAIQLAAYRPYLQEFYNQPLGGSLALDTMLRVNPEQPLLVSNGKIALRNLHVAFNEKEGTAIDTFDIEGLSFDLARNRLEIKTVTSADARTNFSRSKTGEWSFMSSNFPILGKLEEASDQQAEPAPQGEPEEAKLSYRIGSIDIGNWQVDFDDQLPESPAKIEIDNLTLSIEDLAAPEKIMSPFILGMTLQNKGQIEIRGETALADQQTMAKVRLTGLPLKVFAPYIAEQTNLILAGGTLDARLSTKVAPEEENFTIDFGGDVGVSRMHLLDSLHEEDLLKWDSLQIAGINGKLEPFSLEVESIALSDYFAKVLIDEEARVNLVDAFTKESTTEGEESEYEEAEETAVNQDESEAVPAEATSAPRDIRISKIVLQGGQVNFTDRSLPQPFHANMTKLGGLIAGLSSHSATQATVDLRGSLHNQSPLTISGQLNPLAEDVFLDIDLNFHDIEMSPFSPYSENFVGHMIDKGKLNLTLDYSLEAQQLKANNKVFLDQFTFGDAVESENAISLPVKLAVTLLKDGNGEIHLDIPVYGSLDDPQFSIGSVIWTVIKNLLVKAATSPFALLGALVGGSDEDFSSVSFDYGSHKLRTTEQDKLKRMSQALLDRPSLEIEVSGFIDTENDPEAYRKELLSLKIKRLAYLDLVEKESLPEGATEDDITVPAELYAEYLWQVYKKEDFPKPRNFIGMTKKLPEAEMEKLIYANTSVTDEQLSRLAQDRALAVQNFLTETGQIPHERIFLKQPDVSAPPDQESAHRARVELDAVVN